jgi:biopolymer transport protein ExbB/TolQ
LASTSILLNWQAQDIERRLGFAGARFTRVNGLLTFLMACGLSVAFYAALYPLRRTYFSEMFLERGWVPYCIVFLSAWSLAILFVKYFKLRLQSRALLHAVTPARSDFVLSGATVDEVVNTIYAIVDDPRHFVLYNRICVALSNLRNLGQVGDVDEILRSQADQDEAGMETSYALLQGFVWAIPVLGFIGTVVGLSQAIGGFTAVLQGVENVDEIVQSLQGVTVGLATAFETTLEALVAALVIQLLLTVLKKREEEFLDACAEYCGRQVVNKLRLLPFEPELV